MNKDKLKYYLMMALNFLLSMVLAVSIFMLTFSIGIIGIFSSSSFIESKMQVYEQQAIEGFSAELEKYDGRVDVPVEVLTKSISSRDIDVILSKATENFLYSYSTTYSKDEELYNSIKSSMTEYCNKNNISSTDADVSKAACLVVDAANEYFGGSATANVRLFKLAQSKTMVYLIIVPAVLMIASIVVLDLINYGRHRKYSYIGMGIVTSGYLLVLVPKISNRMGFTEAYRYCSNPIYNPAIKDCWLTVIQIATMVGALAIVVGVIMLFRNYRYFKNKNTEFNAVRENNVQLRNEYIEELNAKKEREGKVHVPPANPDEKEIFQVNFGEDE